MADDDIVISGFSARFPQADHLVDFKEKLYAGVDMVTQDDSRWPPGHLGLPTRHGKILDLSRFDAQFFSTHPKQAQALDPQIRLLLETSYEAIVDAGYDPDTLRGRNIGVFVGVSSCDTRDMLAVNADETGGYGLLGCCLSMCANRISYGLDFHGPSVAMDTACSSTMTALNEAVQALRSGRCEAAIVGGSNVTLAPAVSLHFQRLGMLAPDGKCKAFDADGDGFVRSETVGALFLQRASDARRLYAKVINVKSSADGHKAEGLTYPSGKVQADLLLDIYAESNVDPTKGVASVAKVILAMETGMIAANLHFKKPNASIPCLRDGTVRVVNEHVRFPGGPVGINSSGFGGANVHVILEAGPGPHVNSITREKPELPRLVLFAGRTQESLTATLDRVEADGPYPDSAYALLNRVGHPSVERFPWRGFAIVPVDQSDKEVLKVVKQSPVEKRPLWFVFTGLGCQWNGMARQMMHFDVFARSIRKSHELLLPFGVHLMDIMTRRSLLRPNDRFGTGVHSCDSGLTWEEAAKRCPDDVYPVCHNAEDSVTISGLAEAVTKTVAELKSENIFAREVNSLGIAFHCKHTDSIGPALYEALRQAIVRRSVGLDAAYVGLMKRDVDNLEYFLGSLGKLHTLGFQLDLSPLYPPVPWPVPRGTPNIAHLVSWDHSQPWCVVNWRDFPTSSQDRQMAEDIVEVDVEANDADKYLMGHQPDGRTMFPAMGYLVLVWKSVAKRIGKPLDQVPVVFEGRLFPSGHYIAEEW
ncbi:hypothetical protein MTO96_032291 [Rhipicephalus appendiculatus]